MNDDFYTDLTYKSLNNILLDDKTCKTVLSSKKIDLLSLIHAAYKVRRKYFKNYVNLHVINNVQNGFCSEDCHYCAQSKSSKAKINIYPMKSDKEILKEAKEAYESGAFRYCMVFSGASSSENRINRLINLIQEIKSKYKMEVCVSPGVVNEKNLKKLKKAGLNRLNHNLNTSISYYNKICTSHTFNRRVETLQNASKVGLDICSGVIIGMGESNEDIIKMAKFFNSLKKVKSIPVNFLIPIEGNKLSNTLKLNPEFCLRVLCLFRLLNPKCEIRTAAGRELHFKHLEVMCLYPSNSIFVNGYLNTGGRSIKDDLNMIKNAGFQINSPKSIEALIKKIK